MTYDLKAVYAKDSATTTRIVAEMMATQSGVWADAEVAALKAKSQRLYDLAMEAATTACTDRCGTNCDAACKARFAALERDKP